MSGFAAQGIGLENLAVIGVVTELRRVATGIDPTQKITLCVVNVTRRQIQDAGRHCLGNAATQVIVQIFRNESLRRTGAMGNAQYFAARIVNVLILDRQTKRIAVNLQTLAFGVIFIGRQHTTLIPRANQLTCTIILIGLGNGQAGRIQCARQGSASGIVDDVRRHTTVVNRTNKMTFLVVRAAGTIAFGIDRFDQIAVGVVGILRFAAQTILDLDDLAKGILLHCDRHALRRDMRHCTRRIVVAEALGSPQFIGNAQGTSKAVENGFS